MNVFTWAHWCLRWGSRTGILRLLKLRLESAAVCTLPTRQNTGQSSLQSTSCWIQVNGLQNCFELDKVNNHWTPAHTKMLFSKNNCTEYEPTIEIECHSQVLHILQHLYSFIKIFWLFWLCFQQPVATTVHSRAFPS